MRLRDLTIFGRRVFGPRDSHPDSLLPWWVSSQNLDERPGDGHQATGSKLMHGRAWLHTGDRGRYLTLKMSWNLRSTFCHLSLSADSGERDISLSAALPPVAIWFGAEGLPEELFRLLGIDWETCRKKPDGYALTERDIRIAIHDWHLWWSLWMPHGLWKSTDPRWRSGNLAIADLLFGKSVSVSEKISEEHALIPMPERAYPAKITIQRVTVSRARWPFRFGPEDLRHREMLTFNADLEANPIPVPGKGENSWDCGEDAIFSQSGRGGITEAIASVVESATRTRRRHGGKNWVPSPKAKAVQA